MLPFLVGVMAAKYSHKYSSESWGLFYALSNACICAPIFGCGCLLRILLEIRGE